MNLIRVIFTCIFLGLFIHHILCIKSLIVPVKRKSIDFIILITIGVGILIFTYIKSQSLDILVFGIFLIVLMPLSILKAGITDKGVSYIDRGLIGFNSWDKITEVKVYLKKDIEVAFSGHKYIFLRFNKADYNLIMQTLYKNVPADRIKIQ